VLPWQEKTWCIPPTADAAFVARREDLLELSQAPYDARRPVVGMDDRGTQLMAETRVPLPVRAGPPARYDDASERQGVCRLFLCGEPRRGGRKGFVRDRRTKGAWAVCVRMSLDEVSPEAREVRLVQEHVTPQPRASL
jgi:hypothetical protein